MGRSGRTSSSLTPPTELSSSRFSRPVGDCGSALVRVSLLPPEADSARDPDWDEEENTLDDVFAVLPDDLKLRGAVLCRFAKVGKEKFSIVKPPCGITVIPYFFN